MIVNKPKKKKTISRYAVLYIIMAVIFGTIFCKLLYLQVYKYDEYKEKADTSSTKFISESAPRGLIYDSEGNVLATSEQTYVLTYMQTTESANAIFSTLNKVFKVLSENGENFEDNLLLKVNSDGQFYFAFKSDDSDVKEATELLFKSDRGLKDEVIEELYKDHDGDFTDEQLANINAKLLEITPEDTFYYLVELYGMYKMLLPEDYTKEEYDAIVAKYKDVDGKTITKDLLEKYSLEDIRKYMVVKDAINIQSYQGYKSVTIANDITKDTAFIFYQMLNELPGIDVDLEPVRYYPNTTLASHILGHMGKMPSGQEDKYLNREEGKTYSKGDTVGISGIEKSYEEQLRGVDGYKKVQVDALGRITRELDVSEPKSGDTVYLSIDKDLQEDTENALKGVLEALRVGGTYKSKYGNKTFSSVAKNAASGAVIAIDAKNGDVLSMASYPNYNPNKFVNGISYEDYQALQPKNKNDVLAANPQVNLATQGVFQPGSTFKMVTGMAAIDNGLSPNYAIQDTGVIRLGGPKSRPFADLIWHKSRSNHGYTDLYKAIQESCNIYFYTIGSGKNYTGGKDPSVKVGAKGIIEYAKKFGLDDYTGLNEEIEIILQKRWQMILPI